MQAQAAPAEAIHEEQSFTFTAIDSRSLVAGAVTGLAAALAAEHGVPGLICLAGNRNPGQSDLDGMAPCAEQRGVNLNVELLNSRVDHPGYLCDHVDFGVALCEMVNSLRVKLLFDIYHTQIMDGDVIRHTQRSIHWIGHFHTAENPADATRIRRRSSTTRPSAAPSMRRVTASVWATSSGPRAAASNQRDRHLPSAHAEPGLHRARQSHRPVNNSVRTVCADCAHA